MNAMPEAIAELHRELGIPSDYARRRGLGFCAEARDLVDVVAGNGHAGSTPTIRLTRDAADGWRSLHTAARRDGIELLLLSGFRSIERQTEIIRRKLARGQSIESILEVNAAPGYSEHHSGRAVDLATPEHPGLEESFAQTNAFTWLSARAAEFGFTLSYPHHNRHGLRFEPWHWCWQPPLLEVARRTH